MKTFCQFVTETDWQEYKQWVTPFGEVVETDDHADCAEENGWINWEFDYDDDREIDQWFNELYMNGYIRIEDNVVSGYLGKKHINKAVYQAIENAKKAHLNHIEFYDFQKYKGVKIPFDDVGEFLSNPRRYFQSGVPM